MSTRLPRLARVARIAAASCLAALSLYLLVDVGLEPSTSGLGVASAPSRRAPALRLPEPEPPVEDPRAPTPLPSATAEPQPSPRQILVDLGPPRSDVFVDGRRVGQTPFLGQVRCRPGRAISIQVIPERGLPLEERRVCPP